MRGLIIALGVVLSASLTQGQAPVKGKTDVTLCDGSEIAAWGSSKAQVMTAARKLGLLYKNSNVTGLMEHIEYYAQDGLHLVTFCNGAYSSYAYIKAFKNALEATHFAVDHRLYFLRKADTVVDDETVKINCDGDEFKVTVAQSEENTVRVQIINFSVLRRVASK